jgi:hypothetical protein
MRKNSKERKMKNAKNVTNKYKSGWLAVTVLAVIGLMFLLPACGRGGSSSHTEVLIELPDPSSVDFSKYENILYKDITVEAMPKGYDPSNEIKTFFLEDLKRITEKDVELWNREKHGELIPKGLLYVSGKLKLEIKSRSKIQDVKEGGKNKKEFVSVQHWEMIFTVNLKDASTGKEIFNEDYKAKLANADPKTVKFNFENLFFKVTSRFMNKITRTRKMQRRHLIL